MKIKILLFATLFAFGLLAAHAQTSTFSKGTKVLNLGIGFGGNYYSGYSSGVTKTPLISASVDVGMLDNVLEKGSIGIGGFAAYKGYKYESGYDYGFKETSVIIGPRGTFHYPLVDKLDTYAGLLLAYRVVSWKSPGDWVGPNPYSSTSGIYFSGFVGARYYFSSKFGVMMELGSGSLAVGNIGIALKF